MSFLIRPQQRYKQKSDYAKENTHRCRTWFHYAWKKNGVYLGIRLRKKSGPSIIACKKVGNEIQLKYYNDALLNSVRRDNVGDTILMYVFLNHKDNKLAYVPKAFFPVNIPNNVVNPMTMN